jgi:CubicO group peptidase (beta-lactamase class C family)
MKYRSINGFFRIYLGVLIISLFFAATLLSQIKQEEAESREITLLLKEIVGANKAPGIVGAIFTSEGVVAIGSAGVRKAGSEIPFTIDDKVHLGSCTKAMTCVLLATLVEEGRLSWDTRFIDVLPELKSKIHSDYHDVSLWQLVTHRGGIPSWWSLSQKYSENKRLQLLLDILRAPSSCKKGEFHYSNPGYVMAGCMAERITGKSWETLMKERLFGPLEMRSAGFGIPGVRGKTEQPWGHSRSGNSWYASQKDSAGALGPAGTVHCNVTDWSRFLKLFLMEENKIISAKSVAKLTTPTGNYAGGWGVIEQPWAKGVIFTHNGSNSTWYSCVMIAPELNRAYLVVTNSRDFGKTSAVCNEVISRMIKIDNERMQE